VDAILFYAREIAPLLRERLPGVKTYVIGSNAPQSVLSLASDNIEVVGQSGGGLVQVTLTAKGAMRGVTIDASLLRADEKEIVEDLVVTAHEDARKKGERLMEEKMKSVTAGLPLPPGMKLPF
jgi:DNA-binding YbaB/EbfC family protein